MISLNGMSSDTGNIPQISAAVSSKHISLAQGRTSNRCGGHTVRLKRVLLEEVDHPPPHRCIFRRRLKTTWQESTSSPSSQPPASALLRSSSTLMLYPLKALRWSFECSPFNSGSIRESRSDQAHHAAISMTEIGSVSCGRALSGCLQRAMPHTATEPLTNLFCAH